MDSSLRSLTRHVNSPEEIILAWKTKQRLGIEETFDPHERVDFPREDWADRKWKRVVGKGTTWYVPLNDYPAENIHCAGGPNSNGYGGSVITFLLENGEVVNERGPWHSNSESFFHDTGIDIRNTHRTYGAVALEYGKNYSLRNVIYKDKGPTPGNFSRIEKLAQELANLLGVELYFYSSSPGGSHSGSVRPKVN